MSTLYASVHAAVTSDGLASLPLAVRLVVSPVVNPLGSPMVERCAVMRTLAVDWAEAHLDGDTRTLQALDRTMRLHRLTHCGKSS